MGPNVMNILFEKGLGADVLLRVKNDERELKAHRFILVEMSLYFKTMLSVKSATDPVGTLVVGSQMSFDTLHLLVKHMYTGVLEEVTSVAQVKDFIKAAHFFNTDITEELSIENILTVSNICEIANFWFELRGLNEKVLWRRTFFPFLYKNFRSVLAEKTYLGLSKLILQSILSAPGIQIDSEMALFKAIVLWVQHDFPVRHHCFPELFESVMFSSTITIDFLMNTMLPWCSCEETKRHLIYMLALMCGHKDNGPVNITVRKYLP